jgi:hypothetical protein
MVPRRQRHGLADHQLKGGRIHRSPRHAPRLFAAEVPWTAGTGRISSVISALRMFSKTFSACLLGIGDRIRKCDDAGLRRSAAFSANVGPFAPNTAAPLESRPRPATWMVSYGVD